MSKNNVTTSVVTESKVPTNKKKRTAGRTAKLKSRKWYKDAVRSIGITKNRLLESHDVQGQTRGVWKGKTNVNEAEKQPGAFVTAPII